MCSDISFYIREYPLHFPVELFYWIHFLMLIYHLEISFCTMPIQIFPLSFFWNMVGLSSLTFRYTVWALLLGQILQICSLSLWLTFLFFLNCFSLFYFFFLETQIHCNEPFFSLILIQPSYENILVCILPEALLFYPHIEVYNLSWINY